MPPVKEAEPPASLHGKHVVVTGASSGIGRAIAVACAQAGADLFITYRHNRAGAEATAEQVRARQRRVIVSQAHLADDGDISRLVDEAWRELGHVDAWVNNAGADILTGEAARASRLEKLEILMAVDLRGTMVASWAAAEAMQRQEHGGVILNMSWDGVLRGLEGENPELFSAIKGGVLSFSKSLARTVAPRVRVNVLGPGYIETAFGERAQDAWKERVRASIPLARWGRPEDVAGAAVYLASDAASYVTGQMIMVNGGDVM